MRTQGRTREDERQCSPNYAEKKGSDIGKRMKGGRGKGIDGEEGGREDHDWMEEGQGRKE